MAGWASANKYSLLGGLRVAAQLMAYELPFVLAAASVAMAAGTLSLTGIVEAWEPVVAAVAGCPALVVFFVAGLAELQRPPFDMPVADAELVFGPSPSTAACGSRCSCSPSTPASSCSPR